MSSTEGSTRRTAVELRRDKSGRSLGPPQEGLGSEPLGLVEHLRELFDRTGLTLATLAPELDTNTSSLSRYLKGERLPPRVTLMRKLQDWIAENIKDGISEDERQRGIQIYHAAARKSNSLSIRRVSELDEIRDIFAGRVAATNAYIGHVIEQLADVRRKLAASEQKVAGLQGRLGRSEELTAKLAEAEAKNNEYRNKISTLEDELHKANKLQEELREQCERLSAIADAVAESNIDLNAESLRNRDVAFEPIPDLTPARRPRVWGRVPLRDPGFTGRDSHLALLRDRFRPAVNTEVAPLALCGMNGVGKSHIVAEYIYRHGTDYDVVWWIDGGHQTNIRSALVDLTHRLRLPVSGDADAAVSAALEALRLGDPYRRWLLVLDGADQPALVFPFVPAGFGHVVITSCSSEWTNVADVVHVEPFTRGESVQLIRDAVRTLAEADAERLAEVLGDLPLAVSQAAIWVRQTGMQVPEFLTLLEQRPDELLRRIHPEYQEPLNSRWNVPLMRLKNEHPGALELLQLCTLLEPGPISRTVFANAPLGSLPDSLRKSMTDPLVLGEIFRELGRHGLITIAPENGDIFVHPLLRVAVRSWLTREETDSLREAAHLLLHRPGA